jgi:hypothetical protein
LENLKELAHSWTPRSAYGMSLRPLFDIVMNPWSPLERFLGHLSPYKLEGCGTKGLSCSYRNHINPEEDILTDRFYVLVVRVLTADPEVFQD